MKMIPRPGLMKNLKEILKPPIDNCVYNVIVREHGTRKATVMREGVICVEVTADENLGEELT